MGFLSDLVGIAAPIAGGIFGGPAGAAIGGALGGAFGGGSKQSGTQTTTQQQQLDPRIQSMLFGDGGNTGLLNQYQQLLNQPQSAGSAAVGGAAQNWLQNQAGNVFGQLQGGASNLLGSNISAPQATASQSAQVNQVAPAGMSDILFNTGETFNAPQNVQAAQIGAPQNVQAGQVGASQINAPRQNNLDLTSAYQNFIYGDQGKNPYLLESLKAGSDLTNQQYASTVDTLTNSLQRNVLPGLRSNAVLAGQVGGSRQGIAEGLALSDYTKQLSDAGRQLALANSANTLAQQAGSFNQGQDRALSATQSLGALQYGVAQQNAQLAQQAALANQGANLQAGLANQGAGLQAGTSNAQLAQQAALNNYAGQQSAAAQSSAQKQQANLANQQVGNNAAQFNANQIQQANLANQALSQQNNQFNAGLGNQTSLANLQAMLGTNSLNSANQATGMQGLSGLLGQIYGIGQNQDNFNINRAQQVNSLLAPYLSANSSSTTSSPIYQNTAGNILGGAAGALGLYNQFKGLGGGSTNTGGFGAGIASMFPNGY